MHSTTDFAAIGDIHGESAVLEMIDKAAPEGAVRIVVGDLLHGFDTPGTLDYAIDHNIMAVKGNHDVMLDAALYARDPEVVAYIAELLGAVRYRNDTLSDFRAYGLEPQAITATALYELRQRVPDRHKEYIHAMPLYAVIGESVIVHAGLTSQPLEEQLAELDAYDALLRDGEYTDMPPQISGVGLMPTGEYLKLSPGVRVINGHWHTAKTNTATERVQVDGRRVLLAPPRLVNYNYIWDSQQERVIRIDPDVYTEMPIAEALPSQNLPDESALVQQ